MRLLHTRTFEFGEFFDSEIPEYVILSHRWCAGEVSYKDMRKGSRGPEQGMKKIKGFCVMAASCGYNWAWIDTCCIDKRSSAELSEAINSMYNWYERSVICYVYLHDVEVSSVERSNRDSPHVRERIQQKLVGSSWFTRGWTLQELLAPSEVIFFDKNWWKIDTRHQLADIISGVTKIDWPYLFAKSIQPISRASVAEKLSWAAHRVTSRAEDMAYCLLGLFDVNMPLLYGEGATKSFRRLQIEIMRQTSDESLFAWRSEQSASGLLASSLSSFANSGDIYVSQNSSSQNPQRPFSMSNAGLEFLVPNRLPKVGRVPLFLNCTGKDPNYYRRTVCIQLRVIGGMAFRTRCGTLKATRDPTLFDQPPVNLLEDELNSCHKIHIRDPTDFEIEFDRVLQDLEDGTTSLLQLFIDHDIEDFVDYKCMNPGPSWITAASNGRLVSPEHASQREVDRTYEFAKEIAGKNIRFREAAAREVAIGVLASSIPSHKALTDAR